ncbi:MAG: hypothetical protein LBQ79_02420, partial [Deltaproteobacteria bacterium]|nr:hypothetical protein [Deltaproteobacteria bacterium]
DLIEAWTDKIGLDVPFFLWKIHVTLAEAAGAAEEAASDYRAFCGEFEKFFGPLPETWEAD